MNRYHHKEALRHITELSCGVHGSVWTVVKAVFKPSQPIAVNLETDPDDPIKPKN